MRQSPSSKGTLAALLKQPGNIKQRVEDLATKFATAPHSPLAAIHPALNPQSGALVPATPSTFRPPTSDALVSVKPDAVVAVKPAGDVAAQGGNEVDDGSHNHDE
jgi:hypothetical protein